MMFPANHTTSWAPEGSKDHREKKLVSHAHSGLFLANTTAFLKSTASGVQERKQCGRLRVAGVANG